MKRTTSKNIAKLSLMLLASVSLSACGAGERLANVGKAPDMTKIVNPQLQPGYQPVSMPMPAPKATIKQANSLWDSQRQTFFEDQRAQDIGDILTVMIDIKDEAQLDNETERTRDNGEAAQMSNLLGYEASLDRILPEAINPGSLTDLASSSRSVGQGSVEREEEITVKLAAVITQILPNGNFVINGNQEVRVNFEKRILQVDGIIRPEDVSLNNTINYDQIAEARIVYGGEGQITDVQQPRYGQQVYDIIFPF